MAITKVTGALVDIGDLDLTNVGTLHLDSIVSDASPSVITIGHEGSPFGNDSLIIKGNVLIGEDLGDAFNADSVLRIQRSNDRAFLHFKTDADQESAILFGDVDDDVECAIEYEPANKALTFSTGNNTEAIRINEDQKVGINTASPSRRKLEITDASPGIVFHDSDVTNLTHEIVGGGNAGLEISADYQNVGTGYIRFDVGGSERARFTEAGNLKFAATGTGIDFSATADGDNSGSAMTSELLDDYEEGQHTTTVTGNTSGSWSLSSAGDEYTYCKIGRSVHCHGFITVTGESSSVGAIGFTLPFTAISGGSSGDVQDDGEYSFGTMSLINGAQDKAANNYVFVQSGDKAYLYYVSDTGNGAYYDSGDVDTAWAFGFSFTYTAA